MPTVEFTFCAYTSRGVSFSEVSVRAVFTFSVCRSPTYIVVPVEGVWFSVLLRSRSVAPTPRHPPSSAHAMAMAMTFPAESFFFFFGGSGEYE